MIFNGMLVKAMLGIDTLRIFVHDLLGSRLQDSVYLRNHPEGPMEGQEEFTLRVQLREDNVAFLDAYHAFYMPKLHVRCLAQLGHGPRQKLPAFFV
jgi:hypothetical protein